MTFADTLGVVRTLQSLCLRSLCEFGTVHMMPCRHSCASGTVLNAWQLQRRSLRADTRTAQCGDVLRRLHFGSDDIRKPSKPCVGGVGHPVFHAQQTVMTSWESAGTTESYFVPLKTFDANTNNIPHGSVFVGWRKGGVPPIH